MWDSAKKPIKIRSVLQPNGMRHYIVNEDQEESHSKLNSSSKPSRLSSDGNDKQKHSLDVNLPSKSKEKFTTLLHPLAPNELEERRLFDNEEGDFFGIAGSKICNSKKHKGHYSRYFHNFPQSFKENSLLQLQREMEMSRCPHSRSSIDVLDLVPLKSPVIKNLIRGGASKNCGEKPQNQGKGGNVNANQSGTQSTTLCSRIMTWIDLEVKRNAGSKKSSSFPFTSTDLSGSSNELTLPYDISALKMSVSSSSSSSSDISSEESNTCSASQSSSSDISLPKLVPCWRKQVGESQSKVKKSVRIAEDLPRWGKMKRRLGKNNRSMSLNELYDDDEEELSYSSNKKVSDKKGRGNTKACSSDWDIPRQTRADALWGGRNLGEDTEEKETDSSGVVCDQKLAASGRVQVHIFLPQTDSTSTREENSSNVSPRSGDSTS